MRPYILGVIGVILLQTLLYVGFYKYATYRSKKEKKEPDIKNS